MADLTWNGDIGDADIERAMTMGAEVLLDESNRKAPIETGALIRSGVAKAEGNKAAVGYNTPYAIKQHEELGYQHDQGREAKYLENALINNKTQIFDAIADEIKRSLGQ
jgi:hypothetical protein